jgi:manganese oxidase
MELGALVFSPQHIMAPPGEVIVRVTNVDSQVHNISIMGTKTRDLQPGESQDLPLGELGVGVYPMLCEISGHADAGMTGNLHVIMNAEPGAYTGTDTGDSGRDHFHGFDSWEEMQTAMDERAMRFITEEKGEFGGQPLEWTMSDDGYKVFEVTAMLADWEVEPGKVVEAYTYNGTVPAPDPLEVGDKIRIVVQNELPTPTTIHWHGVRVPNSMDGVPPYTQPRSPG